MAISSLGTGSGLDLNGILTKLMQVEAQPLNQLNTKEASYQSKISALGTLQGAVSSLDTALAALAISTSSTPSTKVSLGNSSIGLATATSSAVAGSHTLEVSQLASAQKIATVAQGQQLASAVYTSANASIATGTLSLTVGSGSAHNIAITAGNATLTGLKNAINAASAGVTADIVPNSGGGVRLVITSNTIGSSGKVTTSGLTGFDYDAATDTGSLSQNTASGGRPALGYNSTSDSVPTGTLSITLGTGTATQVVIDSSNNTLAGLRDAINNAGAGVTASLETVSSNNIRLVLTANSTGAANTITTSGLTGFDFDGTTGTGSLSQSTADGGKPAQNAIVKIDGTTYNYSSNTATAITGVTLKLAQTTTSATTLTVTKSTGDTFAEKASAKYRTYKASVGDGASASATATADAVPGSYAFEVSQLATTHRITTPVTQAHKLTSASPTAQALRSSIYSASTDLTDGINDSAIDIAIGSDAPQTVVVPAGSTISDLKDAINNANVGVTASLTADGAGYRLVLTSNTVGGSGKITTSGLTGFDYDSSTATGSLDETQAAEGFSSSADTIAEGTLSIAINGGTAVDIAIASPNNTLAGLKDAINSAGAGVTASIVTDGLGVRLVLTSDTLGVAGDITTSGLDGFEFNGTTTDLSDAASDGGQAAQGYTSAGDSIATGTLKITVGSGTTHNLVIDSSNNTLSGLKDAINAAGLGVSAAIVTISSTDVRLVLTSDAAGTAGAITMTGLDGFAFDSATGTGDLSQSTTDGGQAALSSIIKVNGVTITSDSNTVTDAIQGVTLNLTKVSSSATTLTVSQDKTTALSTALAAIVKAYNDFNTSVVTLGKYDATTKTGGPLLGNSTLRSTSYSVRSAFQSSSVLTGGQSKRLSDIGLEFQKDGSIVFNSAKFATAANNNYDATALLAATFGTSTKSLTTNMLGTKGSITAATDGLKTSISGIDKQREALQLRLTQVETRYRRQFTALDSLVASLNSTSTYLTQQLANLSKINSSSN